MAMGKNGLLAVTFIMIIALLLVDFVHAETSSLSIPQFTAKYLDNSYTTSEISITDPHTGKTTIIPSRYVEQKSIELNIIDQNPLGTVQYNIQFKGHFEVEWHLAEAYWNVPIDLNASLRCTSNEITPTGEVYVPLGRQIDFRVEAFTETEESGWSNIQTITIANGATSTTMPSSTSSPSPFPLTSPSLTPTLSSTIEPTIETTIEPTSTQQHQTGFLGTNLPTEYGYAILAVLVILVVAGLSLAYFKKVRR
jgi:hypothetical protein